MADGSKHERLAQDEPSFILSARDPLAPFLISIWSSLTYGDHEAARAKFIAMLVRIGPTLPIDGKRAGDALDCALAMFRWQTMRNASDGASIEEQRT